MRFSSMAIMRTTCAGILSMLLGFGCSGSSTPKATKPGTTATGSVRNEPESSDRATRDATDSAKLSVEAESGTAIDGPVGTIEGVVKFTGEEIPQSEIVDNTTDPLICGAAISKRDREISPTNKGIRHVMVWLEDVNLPEGYKPPRQNLVVDNRNCQFEPHAAVTTVGSIVEATNSDEVFHTTKFNGAADENLPLVSKGSSQKTVLRRAGMIKILCDKHGWMQAFIRVDPHPFHAVTDADGKFSIANVPAGTYKLKIWHGFYYGQDTEVTVNPDDTTTVEFEYAGN